MRRDRRSIGSSTFNGCPTIEVIKLPLSFEFLDRDALNKCIHPHGFLDYVTRTQFEVIFVLLTSKESSLNPVLKSHINPR